MSIPYFKTALEYSRTAIVTQSSEVISSDIEAHPIQSLVDRCIKQWETNRSGQGIASNLFSSFRYLSSSDKIKIKIYIYRLKKQAYESIRRLESEKRDELEEKTRERRISELQPPIQQHIKEHPEVYEKIAEADSAAIENARYAVASEEEFSKLAELEIANKTLRAADWIFEGIKTGGSVALRRKPSTIIKRKEILLRLYKMPFIRANKTLDDFEKTCKSLFCQSYPKDLAKALIADDLRIMKQAVILLDVVPINETLIGRLLTRNYHRLTSFVTASILLSPNLSTAASRAKFFITAMKELKKFRTKDGRHGDHISFLAIGNALNNASLVRLTNMHKLLGKSYRDYVWGDGGVYKTLSSNYAKVPTAIKEMPSAGIFSPAILTTFLEGAKKNGLEDRINTIGKTALEFKKAVHALKNVEIPNSKMRLVLPKLPPTEYRFPEEHAKLNDDFSEYLYLRSKALQ
jgi:hypothetical protein